LDVGDLLSDTDSPEIRILCDEGAFTPDGDSLQLTPDPLTGELTLPIPEDEIPTSETDSKLSDTVELDDYGRPLDSDDQ